LQPPSARNWPVSFGGIDQSTFSSNVGLSIATGATSRHIALPCGVILILLAFILGLAAVFTNMPPPVMGAILVYVACFMILGGIQLITSRMLDARRTFVVGIPFIFGLSVTMVPGLYAKVPEALAPMFGSSLSLATILVIVLHLLFRIGVKTRAELLLSGDDNAGDKIFAFMENLGTLWGARKEVIVRATASMNEFLEAARTLELANDEIRIVASFERIQSGRGMSLPRGARGVSDQAPIRSRDFGRRNGRRASRRVLDKKTMPIKFAPSAMTTTAVSSFTSIIEHSTSFRD
jgi:Permease family